MTQWWERLEANLNYFSSTLEPQARESLHNSAPWQAAMSIATNGKVIEEKGLWFAIRNGTQVENEMKRLAEGLGEEGHS